jgi:hypothetical protein
LSDNNEGVFHITADDECMSAIADQYGFFWETLWFHPKNKDLRSLRKNPNVLMTDDQVFVPAREIKNVDRATGARHQFGRKGMPILFRMRFTKEEKPRANVPYVLVIDGKSTSGSTDGDGRIQVPIPPRAHNGTLTLGEGKDKQKYVLNLGTMDPPNTKSGAIKRLESLGYDCGYDKEAGLSQALQAFQSDNGLSVSGEVDAATEDKLRQAYGC